MILFLSLLSWGQAKLGVWGTTKIWGENLQAFWAKKNRGQNLGQSKLLDKKQRTRNGQSQILCLNSALVIGWPPNHECSGHSVSSPAEGIRPNWDLNYYQIAAWIQYQGYIRVTLYWLSFLLRMDHIFLVLCMLSNYKFWMLSIVNVIKNLRNKSQILYDSEKAPFISPSY